MTFLLLVFVATGVSFWSMHKIAPYLRKLWGEDRDHDEDHPLPWVNRFVLVALSCNFCLGARHGFYVGVGYGFYDQWAIPDLIVLAFALGFATGLAFYVLDTWAAAAEIRQLRDKEQIGFIRRQKALADLELQRPGDE